MGRSLRVRVWSWLINSRPSSVAVRIRQTGQRRCCMRLRNFFENIRMLSEVA